jgi:hypothetical protein
VTVTRGRIRCGVACRFAAAGGSASGLDADRAGSSALCSLATPQTTHDPGRVLTDLAVAIADGAECISDLTTLAETPALFGPVVSDSTVCVCWNGDDEPWLSEVGAARAAPRESGLGAARRGEGPRCGRLVRPCLSAPPELTPERRLGSKVNSSERRNADAFMVPGRRPPKMSSSRGFCVAGC